MFNNCFVNGWLTAAYDISFRSEGFSISQGVFDSELDLADFRIRWRWNEHFLVENPISIVRNKISARGELFVLKFACLVPYHASRGSKIVLILGYWEQYCQATCKSLTYKCFSNSHWPMSYVKGGEGTRHLGTKVVHKLLSATSNLHSTVLSITRQSPQNVLRWLADYWYARIKYIYQCTYCDKYFNV
jgi:hypothetical protein